MSSIGFVWAGERTTCDESRHLFVLGTAGRECLCGRVVRIGEPDEIPHDLLNTVYTLQRSLSRDGRGAVQITVHEREQPEDTTAVAR